MELMGIASGAASINLKAFSKKAIKYLDTDTDDQEEEYWKSKTCTVGEQVPCPVTGSAGAWCTGNQCCPGVQETGGLPFPCPSAESTWCACSHQAKLRDCTQAQAGATPSTCPGQCPQKCIDLADTLKTWKAACNNLPTDCAE